MHHNRHFRLFIKVVACKNKNLGNKDTVVTLFIPSFLHTLCITMQGCLEPYCGRPGSLGSRGFQTDKNRITSKFRRVPHIRGLGANIHFHTSWWPYSQSTTYTSFMLLPSGSTMDFSDRTLTPVLSLGLHEHYNSGYFSETVPCQSALMICFSASISHTKIYIHSGHHWLSLLKLQLLRNLLHKG